MADKYYIIGPFKGHETGVGCGDFLSPLGLHMIAFLLTVILLIISPLRNSIFEHSYVIEMFFKKYVTIGYGIIVFIVCLFCSERNFLLRIALSLAEAAATMGALWLFFHFVFSYNGSFPFSLYNFICDKLYGLQDVIRILLHVLLLIICYLLFFSPIILLAILYTVFDKVNENSTMSNYFLSGYFRVICFISLMLGFVLFHPAYRVYDMSIAKGGWALIVALLTYLPTSFFSYKMSGGD